jgi:hypothetical protein
MLNKEHIIRNGKKKFIITKRIAKHGSQSIIVIPRILESSLKPGTITQVTINVLDNLEEKNEN